jgi:hypothetical protein
MNFVARLGGCFFFLFFGSEKYLWGLVVRVSGYGSSGPGFDCRPYQIFWEVRGLERGALSLVRTVELLE